MLNDAINIMFTWLVSAMLTAMIQELPPTDRVQMMRVTDCLIHEDCFRF